MASLNSITGKGSTSIRHVFFSSAIFGEVPADIFLSLLCLHHAFACPPFQDERIPQKVFSVLYAASPPASDEGDQTKMPTLILVKRWLSTLVKRSLFMELVRGSISIHECVVALASIVFPYMAICLLVL